MSRSLLLIALAFAMTGCPGDDDSFDAGGVDAPGMDAPGVDAPRVDAPGVDVGPVAPRVEIGTGLTEFIDVADGADVELVAGPQGGWHVDVALRLYGMDPMDMRLRIEGRNDATGDVVTVPVERILTNRRVRDMGDHYLRLGDQTVFMVLGPEEATDIDLRIDVTATPVEGEGASAQKIVHIVDNVE